MLGENRIYLSHEQMEHIMNKWFTTVYCGPAADVVSVYYDEEEERFVVVLLERPTPQEPSVLH